MLVRMLRFEAWYQMTRRSTHLVFLGLIAYTALMVARAAGLVGAPFDLVGDGGLTRLNSPFVAHLLVTLPGYFGIVVVAAVMVGAACRDVRHGACPLVYSKPVPEWAYLAGRLGGALVALAWVFAAPAVALLAVTALPSFPADRLGEWRASAFLMPYVAVVWPNLLVLGTLVFATAAASRREAPAYALAFALLGGWVMARALGGDLAAAPVASLLDPFGYVATNAVMDRIWTAETRDTLAVRLEGPLLANRILWLAIGGCALGWLLARFRFREPAAGRPRENAEPGRADAGRADRDAAPRASGLDDPERRPPPSAWTLLRVWRFEVRRALASRAFLAALGGLLVVGAALARTMGTYEGTPSHPVTFLVLGDIGNSLLPLSLLLLLFWAGELAWREKETGLAEIADATPAGTGQRFLARLLALATLALVLLTVVAGCGMLGQLSRGYLDFQPGVYAGEILGIRLPTCLLWGVLALAVHGLVNHKYAAHVVVAALYALSLSSIAPWARGLVSYASDPGHAYSDFYGYGPHLRPFLLFKAYWAAAAVLIAIAAVRLFPRGTDPSLVARWRRATRGPARPGLVVAGTGAGLALVLLGSVILHETARPSQAGRVRTSAEYERLYQPLASVPQPRLTGVALRVDLHPRRREARVAVEYTLLNAGDRPIGSLHVTLPADGPPLLGVRPSRGWREEVVDAERGFRAWRLASPLGPGESMRVGFDLLIAPRGFGFPQVVDGVVEDGTLLMGGDWAPQVGYQPSRELQDALERRHHGLAPREPLPPAADPLALSRDPRPNSARIAFEAVVSTDVDQTVVAPGRLEREWVEGGRRRFAFRAEVPIWNHYGIASGRYAVRRGEWGGVSLEVYFHPRHGYNVDRLLRAMRDALAYHAARYGPYPYSAMRVVETPRHVPFAGRSYAGLIPLAETGGFLARVVDGEGDVDLVTSLVAHEVAHQWWGHVIGGAAVQGGPLVQETLAQRSRLALVELAQGEAVGRRLLDYARADYLRGRREADAPEPPLVAVSGQPYVYYDKGLLAMHALDHVLGEDRVSAALASFLAEAAARQPPYATSLDLLRHLRCVAPAELHPAIAELLEGVTTYDLRVVDASAEPSGAGFRVRARLSLAKERRGAPAAPADWVEVVVRGEEGASLLRRRVFVDRAVSDLELDVAARPLRVEVDPDGTLFDPVAEDNARAVGGG